MTRQRTLGLPLSPAMQELRRVASLLRRDLSTAQRTYREYPTDDTEEAAYRNGYTLALESAVSIVQQAEQALERRERRGG